MMSKEEFFKRMNEEIEKIVKLKQEQAKAEVKQNAFTKYETPLSVYVLANN
jgi:hypothetical protein